MSKTEKEVSLFLYKQLRKKLQEILIEAQKQKDIFTCYKVLERTEAELNTALDCEKTLNFYVKNFNSTLSRINYKIKQLEQTLEVSWSFDKHKKSKCYNFKIKTKGGKTMSRKKTPADYKRKITSYISRLMISIPNEEIDSTANLLINYIATISNMLKKEKWKAGIFGLLGMPGIKNSVTKFCNLDITKIALVYSFQEKALSSGKKLWDDLTNKKQKEK